MAAQCFRDAMADILAGNAKDMQAADENNLEAALKDRLALDEGRVEAMQKVWSRLQHCPTQ